MELLTMNTRGIRKKFSAVFAAAVLSAAVLTAAVFSGCAALAERGGRLADGSAFAEKTTAVYEGNGTKLRETTGRNGEVSIVITMEKYPPASFRGTLPDEGGNFYFTALEYLGGNYSGWNEFTMELSGAGRFRKDGQGGFLSFLSPLLPVQISGGKIRRNENRITEGEALLSLRNRRERIAALTEWMRKEDAAASVNGALLADGKVFERYWKPLLLPELVPKKKRPESWFIKDPVMVRAEDVNWNTSYTALLFPEDLRILRDGGALLRDWEEAFEWIRLEYGWESIEQKFSDEIYLKKTK
jgi:hypothetical protein